MPTRFDRPNVRATENDGLTPAEQAAIATTGVLPGQTSSSATPAFPNFGGVDIPFAIPDAFDVDPFVDQLSDLQVEALLNQLAAQQALFANQVSQANTAFSEIGLQRDTAVNDVLFDFNQASALTDEQFASRGLGTSGFRIQQQAGLNRDASRAVSDINTSALDARQEVVTALIPNTYQNYLDILEAEQEIDQALLDINRSI